MPTAPALAGLRIAHVDHDGPMAGRAFAEVAFHLSPSFLFVSDFAVPLPGRCALLLASRSKAFASAKVRGAGGDRSGPVKPLKVAKVSTSSGSDFCAPARGSPHI